ncbi:MAG: hypothetical protein KGI57_02315 [Hyphomicrobiales bacterium]|nr:hypothetical protein [Hyphomicrobiales bacterium]
MTEADRISSGMERKKRDEGEEQSPEPNKRGRYRRVRLVSTPSLVRLDDRQHPPRGHYPIREIGPAALLDLKPEPEAEDAIAEYQREWRAFGAAYAQLARRASDDLAGYVEGLIALGERFWWTVPSSTVDDPDVSLHDHGRVAAAVAACL